MKKQQAMPSSNIGMVSLLMIFIVLCLVTFATLSLSNTVSEYHYSQKLAAKNQSYQKAVNRANRVLLQLDEELRAGADAGNFEGIDSFQIYNDGDDSSASFTVSIDDDRKLYVLLRIPEGADQAEVTEWRVVSTRTWESDDSMNLLQ